jgi:hypothetical protein
MCFKYLNDSNCAVLFFYVGFLSKHFVTINKANNCTFDIVYSIIYSAMMVLLKSLLPIAILLVLELVIATHGKTARL